MKTMIQSRTSRNLQASLPFASPVIALAAMLLIAAGSGVAVMMG
jgi:hypothetical protein